VIDRLLLMLLLADVGDQALVAEPAAGFLPPLLRWVAEGQLTPHLLLLLLFLALV
jgi:hypothetical protein